MQVEIFVIIRGVPNARGPVCHGVQMKISTYVTLLWSNLQGDKNLQTHQIKFFQI